jgi:hypothetical protein
MVTVKGYSSTLVITSFVRGVHSAMHKSKNQILEYGRNNPYLDERQGDKSSAWPPVL